MTTPPFFSVIVPTYRRPERLAACLRALAGLDYPRERFEVIVVDDGGGATLDGAPATIDLTLVTQAHAGPAAATHAATRSPFQTARPGTPSPSTLKPSVST